MLKLFDEKKLFYMDCLFRCVHVYMCFVLMCYNSSLVCKYNHLDKNDMYLLPSSSVWQL